MGIPGLARRLEPYASCYPLQQLDGYQAVVDGPSLAYHAHKLALSATANQSRIPSYADINYEAIRWLQSLEDHGNAVLTVLFDGALPDAKRAERISRTEQNNKRVQQLRASYPTTACPIPTYLGPTSHAFLAPALREALASSDFATRTQVVPGEADDSCALYAKETPRSIIFSSDTDLLLYDYSPETLIVFFQDAEWSAGIKAYSPREIKQKLQVKSLLSFAYGVNQRSSEYLADLVRDAENIDVDSPAYLEFSRRYIISATSPAYLGNHNSLGPSLQCLDVRISEFVHQALQGTTTPHIYLPLLVEDPNQASAWNMAQDCRTLSYSLLASKASNIQEYRRKAQGFLPQELNLYSSTAIQGPAKELETQVGALLRWKQSKSVGSILLWPLFALSLVLADLNTPPSSILVTRVINGDFDNTWPFIHLAARLQASLYSLRMLKQVVTVWLALDQQGNTALRETLSSLQAHLSTFPTIPETFTIAGQAKQVLADHETLKTLVEEIYTSVGAEIPIEPGSNKKKKRMAREAERKKRKMEQRQLPKTDGSNNFALLKDGGLI